jgi:hypothetical protein
VIAEVVAGSHEVGCVAGRIGGSASAFLLSGVLTAHFLPTANATSQTAGTAPSGAAAQTAQTSETAETPGAAEAPEAAGDWRPDRHPAALERLRDQYDAAVAATGTP